MFLPLFIMIFIMDTDGENGVDHWVARENNNKAENNKMITKLGPWNLSWS